MVEGAPCDDDQDPPPGNRLRDRRLPGHRSREWSARRRVGHDAGSNRMVRREATHSTGVSGTRTNSRPTMIVDRKPLRMPKGAIAAMECIAGIVVPVSVFCWLEAPQ